MNLVALVLTAAMRWYLMAKMGYDRGLSIFVVAIEHYYDTQVQIPLWGEPVPLAEIIFGKVPVILAETPLKVNALSLYFTHYAKTMDLTVYFPRPSAPFCMNFDYPFGINNTRSKDLIVYTGLSPNPYYTAMANMLATVGSGIAPSDTLVKVEHPMSVNTDICAVPEVFLAIIDNGSEGVCLLTETPSAVDAKVNDVCELSEIPSAFNLAEDVCPLAETPSVVEAPVDNVCKVSEFPSVFNLVNGSEDICPLTETPSAVEAPVVNVCEVAEFITALSLVNASEGICPLTETPSRIDTTVVNVCELPEAPLSFIFANGSEGVHSLTETLSGVDATNVCELSESPAIRNIASGCICLTTDALVFPAGGVEQELRTTESSATIETASETSFGMVPARLVHLVFAMGAVVALFLVILGRSYAVEPPTRVLAREPDPNDQRFSSEDLLVVFMWSYIISYLELVTGIEVQVSPNSLVDRIEGDSSVASKLRTTELDPAQVPLSDCDANEHFFSVEDVSMPSLEQTSLSTAGEATGISAGEVDTPESKAKAVEKWNFSTAPALVPLAKSLDDAFTAHSPGSPLPEDGGTGDLPMGCDSPAPHNQDTSGATDNNDGDLWKPRLTDMPPRRKHRKTQRELELDAVDFTLPPTEAELRLPAVIKRCEELVDQMVEVNREVDNVCNENEFLRSHNGARGDSRRAGKRALEPCLNARQDATASALDNEPSSSSGVRGAANKARPHSSAPAAPSRPGIIRSSSSTAASRRTSGDNGDFQSSLRKYPSCPLAFGERPPWR